MLHQNVTFCAWQPWDSHSTKHAAGSVAGVPSDARNRGEPPADPSRPPPRTSIGSARTGGRAALSTAVHTAGVHLSRAYAKLGVRSRTQLAAPLTPQRA